MYFAYGWPKAFEVCSSAASEAPDGSDDVLGAGGAGDGAKAAAKAGRQIVQILADDDLIVVITGNGVQVHSTWRSLLMGISSRRHLSTCFSYYDG